MDIVAFMVDISNSLNTYVQNRLAKEMAKANY